MSVFEGFSWEVPAGGTVLLGPNGAGRTTLLAQCASALTPRAGSVLMGHSPAPPRPGAFRRLVCWTPQQVQAVAGPHVPRAGRLRRMAQGLDPRAEGDHISRPRPVSRCRTAPGP
ncbi:MAG: ATP-binding cassette domain-containing protein [Candidatus Limnocylindrales bacterium]